MQNQKINKIKYVIYHVDIMNKMASVIVVKIVLNNSNIS